MQHRPLPTPRRAVVSCVCMGVTGLVSAGLVAAAMLLAAPPAAMGCIALLCVAYPVAVAYDLPPSIAALRQAGIDPVTWRARIRLRRQLDRLPETEHPLGL